MHKSGYALPVKIFLFAFVSLFVQSCDLSTDPKVDIIGGGGGSGNGTTGNVTITGTINNASSGSALDTATVRAITNEGTHTTTTNSSGSFTLNFNLTSNQTVTLIISKTGFVTDTTQVFATVGNTNSLVPIALRVVTVVNTVSGSGPPSSVYLLSQSTTTIGVRQSGSVETVRLTFQVVDSAGRNISISNTSLVRFRIGAAPAGGEYLSPEFAFTDTAGQATVILTSGTRAGIVQLTAEVTTTNRTIVSNPVGVAIHGGLPDPAHFSVASQFLNFAGYNRYGLENSVTAFVGDKYGNPVRPGTRVYFTTTGGIIIGSSETDEAGRATVNLLSAAPQPFHATLGAGFATVTASTADENSQTISTSTVVLFSGISQLTINPSSGFDIANGSSLEFIYEVKDQNNNPLAPGTSVSVTVEGENVVGRGALSFSMGDTQSKSATRFSFIVSDTNDTTVVVKPVYITITTDGSNGRSSLSINGVNR